LAHPPGISGAGFRLSRAARGVLLGADPPVALTQRALEGLMFSGALPKRLAVATLPARLADLDSAATVLAERVRFANAEASTG
jgi:hypothetical protein